MTTLIANLSLELLRSGVSQFAPISTMWPNSINITFLTSVPSYYPVDYDLAFVGTDKDGTAYPLHQTDLFKALTVDEQNYVRVAAFGDEHRIGFTEFTAGQIVEVPHGMDDPTGITFGKLNYAAVSNILGFPIDPVGAVTLSIGKDPDLAWSYGLLEIPDEKAAGDIWIFQGAFNYRSTFVHEFGHALGLHHSKDDLGNGPRGEYDARKYTIMSYEAHPTEGAWADEWQIFDISALQYLYGRGTGNSGNQTYSKFDNGAGKDRI